jgi:BirA family biotin operon repressor/biotin-[acetyl-CoA-carboxylase] ligase
MTAARWTQRLEGAACGAFQEIVVVDEAASTQDTARQLGAKPGTVVAACRQTAGRGRLGRVWADTGDKGIAVSFVIARPDRPEPLAIAAAVGTAIAAESLLRHGVGSVGIKWPNDVVVDGRKLAGILIEQWGDRSVIGVGMNVTQTDWPPELAGRAVSLAQLGATCTRLDALAALVRAVSVTLPIRDDQLCEQFARRDVLPDTLGVFRTGERTITGTVVRIDPMHGLLVRTDREHVYLPAATTTVVDWWAEPSTP